MMIGIITILSVLATVSGDFRARAEYSWPEPAGISENSWCGNAVSFYERLRLDMGLWSAVFFTEKDPGEEWGDLTTGGLAYSNSDNFSAAVGALQVQVAQGLILCHPGPWSGGDPLSLAKTAGNKLRLKLSESPGANDADQLTGLTSLYTFGNMTISTVLGWSKIDPGSSGLHRTESEIQSRGSVDEKLVFVRGSIGSIGLSMAHIIQNQDSTESSFSRIGGDFLFENESSKLAGEVAADFDSTFNFLVSGSRGLEDVRFALTISRYTGSWPRSGGSFGSNHKIGAGYGIRWSPWNGVVLDTGVLVLDKETDDVLKTGFQLSERIANRTTLTQRLKITMTQQESTYRAQATASWSPYSDLTLSLKVPFTWYRSNENPDESGTGIEVRLKHNPWASTQFTLSAAAASTNGWNSRVYAYSLSFPGEFGSKALYDSSVLLQGAVSFDVTDSATFRLKAAWYNKKDAEFLGSGSSETPGSSRTSAGVQLDWDF